MSSDFATSINHKIDILNLLYLRATQSTLNEGAFHTRKKAMEIYDKKFIARNQFMGGQKAFIVFRATKMTWKNLNAIVGNTREEMLLQHTGGYAKKSLKSGGFNIASKYARKSKDFNSSVTPSMNMKRVSKNKKTFFVDSGGFKGYIQRSAKGASSKTEVVQTIKDKIKIKRNKNWFNDVWSAGHKFNWNNTIKKNIENVRQLMAAQLNQGSQLSIDIMNKKDYYIINKDYWSMTGQAKYKK